MGTRGEIASRRLTSNNERRTYFFNIKENRTRDLFVSIVESKKQEGLAEFDRHQIVVFEDDLYQFEQTLRWALDFIQKRRRENSGGGSGRDRTP